MTEREKMLSGALYNAGDKELAEAHMRARRLCRQYNELPPDEEEARDCVRMELLGGYKRYAYMEPPVWFDYGCNLFVGENFYANYNLTVLDCARVPRRGRLEGRLRHHPYLLDAHALADALPGPRLGTP